MGEVGVVVVAALVAGGGVGRDCGCGVVAGFNLQL